MRIIDRYLFREVAQAWVAVTLILLLVTLGLAMGDTLADVARGKVPADLLLTQLTLYTLKGSTVLVPLSFFLAVMLSFGKLYRDSEMAVLAACGQSRWSLYRPLAFLVAPLLVVMTILSMWVSPWALRTSKSMLASAASEVSISGLKPGQFHEIASGGSVVYVESLDEEGRFTNAFIHLDRGGRKDIVTARSGYQYQDEAGTKYLVLLNGQRSEGVPGQADFRWMNFARNDVRLPQPDAIEAVTKMGALPLSELLTGDSASHWAELQWRLAPIAALLVLTALANPLSRTTPRKGYYGNLVLGVMLYIVYANLLAIGTAWLEDDPPWRIAGLWWVHAIGLALAAWLLRNRHRRPALGAS